MAHLKQAIPHLEHAIPSQGVLSLIGRGPRPMGDGGFNESLRYVDRMP